HAWLGMVARMTGIAVLVALPFYWRLLWLMSPSPIIPPEISNSAVLAGVPPPVAWGYPQDWAGLWWLVSGSAYRAYLFDMTLLEYGGRLASLARILTEQFTPVGLAFVIGGFAVWDQQRPFLRNGALLWILPVSLY